MERGDGSLLGAAGGADPRHEPAPLPLARAIAWIPRGADQPAWPAPGERAASIPLFLVSDALEKIRRHLEGPEDGEGFGFLVGRLYRCPRSDVAYAVAESTHPADARLAGTPTDAAIERAWLNLTDAPDGAEALLLGWYHGHDRQGLLLTDPHPETNARLFGAPWQCSVVVAPHDSRSVGGVFRPAAVPEQPGRPMPFFELLRRPHGGDVSAADSAVNWANYEPRRPLPPPIPGNPALVRSVPDPSGEARPMPGVPIVIPGEGAPTGLLPPRSRQLARPIVIAGLAVLALTLVFLLRMGDDPAPVTTRPLPTRSAPVEPAPSPEVRTLLDRVTELESAGERYAERAGDFDAGRIGCALLSPGYAAADEAYVAVAAAFRSIGNATATASDAYERAGREIAAVNAHFDATGCERP